MKKYLLLVLIFLPFVLTSCHKSVKAKPILTTTPYSDTTFSLGTVCTIKVYDKNHAQAVQDGLRAVERVNNEATLTQVGSIIDHINDDAGIRPTKVTKDFWPLIKKAVYFSKNSDGHFDLAIGAITNLWKIGLPGARVPAPSEIRSALPLVNWRNVQLNTRAHTIFLTKRGMRLDFGGIAKGWAADAARKALKKDGVTTAIIDLGGNIIVMGHSPKGKNRRWRVGIQNPNLNRGTSLGTIRTANKSIVTAGTYEQYLMSHGHKYIYLFDAKTGYPYDNNLIAVTIVSPNSVDGDALSNAAFAKGLTEGLRYMNRKSSQHIQAIFLTNNKKVYLTKGLKKNFKLDSSSGYSKGNF
ncbi:FAD:protein FMN transferase [Lactiplantibacillus plantarum]|uniref:FAD:protein FMN transferase n=1 Tax=Lactiplantibacillus plantarum TaxID=1590 RepID=UPI001C1F85F9|nr:FAD:protein FMN transferase [Lactiplantibacillus plantarum]MBU7472270.1 FAD:protein FMN transferase [Lactiplantibacillus plantarum]